MAAITRAEGPAVNPTAGPAALAWRAGASAVVWLVALAVTVALGDWLARANFAVFWIAVLFAAWHAGFAAALVSAVLSVVAVEYFVAAPRFEFGPVTPSTVATLTIFVLASALVSALAASRARAQRAADGLAADLQEQAVEL